MSSTNKTANLELNQWVGTDPVLMADFNADNAKIDAAMAALQSGALKAASGSYTGDGTSGQAHPNTLTFDFSPKLVLVWSDESGMPGCICPGMNTMLAWTRNFPYGGVNHCSVSGNAVSWYHTGSSFSYDRASSPGPTYPSEQFNENGRTYHYIAIG